MRKFWRFCICVILFPVAFACDQGAELPDDTVIDPDPPVETPTDKPAGDTTGETTGVLRVSEVGEMAGLFLRDEVESVKVTGTHADGRTVSVTENAGGKDRVRITLPSGIYPEGLDVAFTDKAGTTCVFTIEGPLEIKAGKYIDAPEFLDGEGETGVSKTTSILIKSASMNKYIPATVITPDCYDKGIAFPVVYFLHGYDCTHAVWAENAAIEEFASKYDFIAVCPDGGLNSWYFDSPVDPSCRYETHISSEVVDFIDANYKTIPDRSKRAITGFSMGGHGAFYIAIRHQDKFANVGSLSGGVDIRPFPDGWDLPSRLGSYSQYPENWEKNTVMNMTGLIEPGSLNIIFDCGTSDFFLEVNQKLHRKLDAEGIEHTFNTSAGGHNFDYWSKNIESHIIFFKENFTD